MFSSAKTNYKQLKKQLKVRAPARRVGDRRGGSVRGVGPSFRYYSAPQNHMTLKLDSRWGAIL